jgi:hypothetical protein
MEIKHRAGLKHRNADSLSRHPCHQCGYTDDWDQENQVRVVQQVTTEEENRGTDNTSEEKVMESLEKLQNEDTDISGLNREIDQFQFLNHKVPWCSHLRLRGRTWYLKKVFCSGSGLMTNRVGFKR